MHECYGPHGESQEYVIYAKDFKKCMRVTDGGEGIFDLTSFN